MNNLFFLFRSFKFNIRNFLIAFAYFLFVLIWHIYIPEKIKRHEASCLRLNVSPKKNQPKNTAPAGRANKNGENLLAGSVHIAKLYNA